MMLVALAGLLGAAGVSLAAMAAHVEDSVALRAAAELAMVHAVAGIAVASFAGRQGVAFPLFWTIAGYGLVLGAGLFTAAVSGGVLADFRPLPMAAPVGGSLTIIAWLGVVVAAALEGFGKGRTRV